MAQAPGLYDLARSVKRGEKKLTDYPEKWRGKIEAVMPYVPEAPSTPSRRTIGAVRSRLRRARSS